MARIGNSWKTLSWSDAAWASRSWQGIIGSVVGQNTVAKLGALFKKTSYGSPVVARIHEAPVAVKKFLDELKVERKRSLTEERRKLAALKTEVRKVEERLADIPLPDMRESVTPEASEGEALSQTIRDLEDKVAEQSAIVRARRKELAEAEQARVDQLAEYALEEWNREEDARKAELARMEAEDDEMRQILLLVHEL